jgi:diadenosine tetraphosphate (Ap4A) HIT family hydrolase
MSAAFVLHPRLEADSAPIGQFALCQLRLMNDSRFPWLLLIPARAGLCEVHGLEPALLGTLMTEIAQTSAVLQRSSSAEKINIGALGNLVPQLHVHVVGRFARDAAWPGPVWGSGAAQPYAPGAMEAFTIELFRAFAQDGITLKAT